MSPKTTVILLAVLWCVSVPTPAPAADATLLQNAERYYTQRDKSRLPNLLDLKAVRERPSQFRNFAIEIKGTVFALGGADRRSFVLLRLTGAVPLVSVELPLNTTHSDWPELVEGAVIRALCLVEKDPESQQGFLIVSTTVGEDEASAMDTLRVLRKQAPPAGAPPAPGQPAVAGAPTVAAYVEAIRRFRPGIDAKLANTIAGAILRYSQTEEVDPRLVLALVAAESRFNPTARSKAGAIGLAQLLPGTAEELDVRDPYDPEQNVQGAIRYLKRNMDIQLRQGRPRVEAIRLALASYNAGPGRVRQYKGIPPFAETQKYVATIMGWYWQMLPDEERTWSAL
ncbi:MAG: transglycosylase [Armatimonadetes bacterium]|nr:transglycosylase [Armatimonadota bacterium]